MLALQQQTEHVSRLSDNELIESLRRVLSQERGVHARLLVHIAEVDDRGLYRERAYSSMFEYCVDALHMSEADAYLRIRGARLGREFPRVLVMLEAGELHLSALKLLGPVLNHENADELLQASRFKSKRDLEILIAARFQKPDVPTVIRRLPQPNPARGAVAQPLLTLDEAASPPPTLPSAPTTDLRSEPPSTSRPSVSANANPSLEPLGPARYKLQFTACQQLHDKLRQARDLMRHELPNGDVAQIVEEALDLLIADLMKKRFGVGRKARVTSSAKARESRGEGRHIRHAVRREVVARDGTQCSFVSPEGRRCAERGWLELHHEEPYGKGGPGTPANVRVLCRVHNALHAERDYGRHFMEQRIKDAQRERAQRQLALGPATRLT